MIWRIENDVLDEAKEKVLIKLCEEKEKIRKKGWRRGKVIDIRKEKVRYYKWK